MREVADRGARSTSTSSSPSVGTASPAQMRRSVVFPEPFGPVTTANPPRGTARSTSRSTRLRRSAGRAFGPRSRGQSRRSASPYTGFTFAERGRAPGGVYSGRGNERLQGVSPTMFRPRIAIPVVLVARPWPPPALRPRRATRQTTQAAAADFSAGSVSRSSSQTCTASDGAYQIDDRDLHRNRDVERRPSERHARDPRVERRQHDDESRLARRHAAHPRHERRRERHDPRRDRERRGGRLPRRPGHAARRRSSSPPSRRRSRRPAGSRAASSARGARTAPACSTRAATAARRSGTSRPRCSICT